MTRVLGLLAALLWIVGIVVLVIGATHVTGPLQFVKPPPAPAGAPIRVQLVSTDEDPVWLLYTGIGLVGAAGVLAAGLVLGVRRR